MSEINSCPQCGQPLDPELAGGLCPECLLRQGVQPTVAAPYDPKSGPLTPEHLAPSFPELEIEALLGFGGMGAVYRARQVKLDRMVALKVIHPETVQDPAFAERFEREARAMAKLSHPHIVTIHDFDRFELVLNGKRTALFYILMEYVDGADLRDLLDEKKLTSSQALQIVQQVCDALQFAHSAGVVHRDIKPENILIDQQGMTRIADFGLAKLAEGSVNDYTLTGTHQVVGTPRYMAPEQLAGNKEIDHRADLYSLGVVFYEMLTGELPLGRFELPSESGVDVRLDDVVLKTLAKEPSKRYQHASEIRDEVRVLSELPLTPSITPPVRQTPKQPVAERSSSDSTLLDSEATKSAVALYSQILLLVAVVGFVTIAMPWTSVQVNWKLNGSNTSTSVLRFYGYQYTIPLAPALMCLFVIVQSYVLWLNKKSLNASRAMMAIGAGLALVVVGLLCMSAIPVVAIDSSKPTQVGDQVWQPIVSALREHYEYGRSDVEVFTQIGPGFAIAAGLLMIAASVWELTTIVKAWGGEPNSTNPTNPTSQDRRSVESIGQWLRRLGWLHWGALLGTIILAFYWHAILPMGRGPTLLYIVMGSCFAQSVACLLFSPLFFVAARRLESLESLGLVRGVSILCMIPLSPAWVIGLPLGIWLWLTVHADSTEAAFAQTTVNFSEAQHRLRRIGYWIAVIGITHFVLWMGFAIVTPVTTRGAGPPPPRALLFLPVLLFTPLVALNAWMWIAARSMNRLASQQRASSALWLGLLPLGPGWIITLPLSIVGLSLLAQPLDGAKSPSNLFESA